MAVIQTNLSTQSRAGVVRGVSVIFESVPLDSFVPVIYPKWTAEVDTFVRRIRMKYTVAAAVSGDPVGAPLALGQDGETTYFGAWNSAQTAALWTLTEISVPPQNNVLLAGKTLILFVGRGKTNGGMANIQIELEEVR